jgi:hypothetical protein
MHRKAPVAGVGGAAVVTESDGEGCGDVWEVKPGVADRAVQAAIWRGADPFPTDIASTHRRIAQATRMFGSDRDTT